jgi:hypothetical protein
VLEHPYLQANFCDGGVKNEGLKGKNRGKVCDGGDSRNNKEGNELVLKK